MTTMADVVVVGGGVFGCSALLHLTRAEVGHVVVIDSGGIASGTTPAGAGFVGLWAAGYAEFWDSNELTLQQYGIDLYGQLASDGAEIGYRRNGNIWIATSDRGLSKFVEPMTTHPLAPAGATTLRPEEIASLTGVISPDAVVGGFLHPDGIQVNTAMACTAMATEAARRGAEIRPHTQAIAPIVRDGRIRGISTTDGAILASAVVIAAGAWSNELLRPIGWHLPLLPTVASRVIAQTAVPPSMPTVMVPEWGGLWIREYHGSLTYGNSTGYRPAYELGLAEIPHRPQSATLVSTMISALASDINRLIPALIQAPSPTWTQGVPCYTPDRRFLVGAVPGVNGLFVMAGDNEAGVTHGPGLGRLIADLVTSGSSDFVDPNRYRLDRYTAGQYPNAADVAAAMPARR